LETFLGDVEIQYPVEAVAEETMLPATSSVFPYPRFLVTPPFQNPAAQLLTVIIMQKYHFSLHLY
jgi:hypothetical protein